MENCKWWEVESDFLADGSCEKPVPKLSKLERRRTGKEYPEVATPISCKGCQIAPVFSFVAIGVLLLVPVYAISLIKSE